MKYALIGCGRVSPNHITAVLKNRDLLEPAAVCDVVEERAAEAAAEFSKAGVEVKIYTDYKLMIDETKPELCAIATDSGYHAKIGLYCLNNGANVIIEKPIALSMNDAGELIETAERNGLVLCANHQNRFNRSVRKMRDYLEHDKFGKLFHGVAQIRWRRSEEYFNHAAWRGTWELDGGALMNQCIHNIDLLRWMMGDDVVEVYAYTDRLAHDYIEAEDLGIALIKFKNGSYGIIEGTTNIYPTNLEETLSLFGSDGTMKLGGTSVNKIDELFLKDAVDADAVKAEAAETPENVYGYGHTFLYKDVIESIQSGRKPCVDGAAGKRALELVLAIYKSAAEGKPVKLPLECNVSTLDFVGRF